MERPQSVTPELFINSTPSLSRFFQKGKTGITYLEISWLCILNPATAERPQNRFAWLGHRYTCGRRGSRRPSRRPFLVSRRVLWVNDKTSTRSISASLSHHLPRFCDQVHAIYPNRKNSAKRSNLNTQVHMLNEPCQSSIAYYHCFDV